MLLFSEITEKLCEKREFHENCTISWKRCEIAGMLVLFTYYWEWHTQHYAANSAIAELLLYEVNVKSQKKYVL